MEPVHEAYRIVSERGIMPTHLGSGELAKLDGRLWEKFFFSARTTNASYLQHLKELVDRYVSGGYNNDLGQLRVEARSFLKAVGYNPITGFPGNLGEVPPADPDSLQDLSSEARLNLIFETNAYLARGLGQKTRGEDPHRMELFPAWELFRIAPCLVPCGSEGSSSAGWPARWVQLGGTVTHDGGKARLIALKSSPIWSELGSRKNFPDALGIDHPPFGFRSGYGWREVSQDECVRLAIVDQQLAQDFRPEQALGEAVDLTRKQILARKLRAIRVEKGHVTAADISRIMSVVTDIAESDS